MSKLDHRTTLSMKNINQALFVASTDAAFKVELTQLIKAASLMALDPKNRDYLMANDPNALSAIIEAIEAFAGDYVY